jgi:hypothetical protein
MRTRTYCPRLEELEGRLTPSCGALGEIVSAVASPAPVIAATARSGLPGNGPAFAEFVVVYNAVPFGQTYVLPMAQGVC